MASSTIDLRIAAAASRKPRSRIILRVAIVAAAAAIAAALALLPDPAKAASSPIVIKMADTQPFYTPAKCRDKSWRYRAVGERRRDGAFGLDQRRQCAEPEDTSMPKGAVAFDSGFIPPGGDYSYTFTVPGTYRYFCLPHEKAGMVGVIVVKK